MNTEITSNSACLFSIVCLVLTDSVSEQAAVI